MLEDWIASFIRDDLGFFLSMCIGVMSAGHNLKKRPMLWLKILLYTLVMFSWSTIFFARTVRGWPGYLVAFAITFVWTLLLFECRPLTALYCVTAAYCAATALSVCFWAFPMDGSRKSYYMLRSQWYFWQAIFLHCGEELIMMKICRGKTVCWSSLLFS